MTNFWFLLTKSTTLEILWALKPKKEITKIKTKLLFLIWLKRATGLKTCFGGAFDKLLVFVEKSTTLEILWELKPKKEITKIKNKTFVPYMAKTSNWFKTCFGGAFDQLLVFVAQKYHT